MVPVGLTLGGILTSAGVVVGEFSTLITLVAGFAVGVWGVKFLIRQVKAARG